MDDASQQEVMMNNSRLLKEMFHLEDTGTVKKYAKILGEFVAKGASLLFSVLKSNTGKSLDNVNNNQQSIVSNVESSKTQSKRSKLLISWKDYASSIPQQSNPTSNILQENQSELPQISKIEIKSNQFQKQGDRKTPDSSFSDQYDSLKKRIKRDTQEKSSDTCTMAQVRQENYQERRQFQKLQFQSFHMIQSELRKVKKQFESRTEMQKANAIQKDYQRYIQQNYGSNYNTSDHKQFVQLKNLKRAKEARADRRPLRKKIHLQDEPQSLYDISKVYASFQNQKKRREAERMEEKRLMEERQLKYKLQEQRRRQEQLAQERKKIQEQQQLMRRQLQQQNEMNIKQSERLKQQQRLNKINEKEQQISSKPNLPQSQKSQQNQVNPTQKSEESKELQTPKKINSAEFKQSQVNNAIQMFPPQVNAEKEIKEASPNNQNIPFSSPQQTPASAKKQNPFIKSSPTQGLNLQDIIKNNKTAFSFPVTSLAPSNNILSRNTPVVNIFTNSPQPMFQIGKDQGLSYNPNQIQQQNPPPFMSSYNSNSAPTVPFSNQNPNASFNSSFNASSSSSSFYQSPPNLSQSPGINNSINMNSMNPMNPAPMQSMRFSNNENATKFFENNPFMSSPPQPPGLFSSQQQSSLNPNQSRRSRDGTKKPIRIS